MGGCPFAGDELVGNIPTEAVLTTLSARGVSTGIDHEIAGGRLRYDRGVAGEILHAVEAENTAQTGKPN